MRDNKGRLSKKIDEGLNIVFYLPSLKKMILWITTFLILMPWITIFLKLNILQIFLEKFEKLLFISMNNHDQEQESPKKNGFFS